MAIKASAMMTIRTGLCVFDVVSVSIIRAASRAETKVVKIDPQQVGCEPQGRSIAFFRGWGNLQRQPDALLVPDVPKVERADRTLESLGQKWANEAKRYQRDMLRLIFEGIYIDMIEKRLVCVRSEPQFAPLFRLDGLREKEGCFYVDEEEGQEAGPEG